MKYSRDNKLLMVSAGGHEYPVVVGHNLTSRDFRTAIPRKAPKRIFLVCDARFHMHHGRSLERLWGDAAGNVTSITLASDERRKSIKSVSSVQDRLIAAGIAPNDLIVAAGGGVTSDLVGFAAATLFRGVRWGICSSTLLGMVDASIGGKTGVNHARGKNLIGAYWQPSFVIDDYDWLSTLSDRDFHSGAAEIVKAAALTGGPLLRAVSAWSRTGFDRAYPGLGDIIRIAIAFKAEVVAEDERDAGLRLILNFGHTIGHAIEQSLDYRGLTHGEAVLLGMRGALDLSKRVGVLAPAKSTELELVLARALTRVPRVRLSAPDILRAMQTDKKRLGRERRFVLLKRPGAPIVRAVSDDLIAQTVKELVASLRK